MNPEISSSIFSLGLGFSAAIGHYLYHNRKINVNKNKNNEKIEEKVIEDQEVNEDKYEKIKEEKTIKKCKIYYASQTGTAERYSRILSQKLSTIENICEQNPVNLEDFERENFFEEGSVLIFLISTHYDGLFPDNTLDFVKFIKSQVKKGKEFEEVKFCIFGLGSTEYDYFNEAAKELEKCLKLMKCKEFSPIFLCDEINGVNREYEKWEKQLFKSLSDLYGVKVSELESKETKEPIYYKSWRYQCDLELRYVKEETKNDFEAVTKDVICKQQWQCTESKVIKNFNLIPNSDQKVHHIEFEYEGDYNISDTVYVLYRNPKHVVEYFMELMNLEEEDLKRTITFAPRYGNVKDQMTFSPPFPVPTTVKECLELYCDLTSLPEDEDILKLCTFIKDKKEVERIERLVNNRKIMKHIREEVQPTLHEFIEMFFPKTQFNISGFLQLVPKQKPKAYTISSKPKNGTFSITVKLIEYNLHSFRTFYKTYLKTNIFKENVEDKELFKRRIYRGNCSRYLCNLEQGDTIKFFIRPSSYSKVDLSKPILLIGNGTGIAAFRGMWQSLQEQEQEQYKECHNEKNKQDNDQQIEMKIRYKQNDKEEDKEEKVLLLGFRTEKHILYKDELDKLDNLRGVKVMYAFSREQNKIYVQDLIKSNLSLFEKLIENKGTICICGSRRMGNGVKLILKNFIKTFDLEEMKRNQTFIEELW